MVLPRRRMLAALAGLPWLCAQAAAAEPLTRVQVWLSAFIPRDIPGLTRPVPGGPNAGRTMIPGPLPFSNAFLTDNRTFSDSPAASSRMQAWADIDVVNGRIVAERRRCDQTVELTDTDGAVKCSAVGDSSRLKFQNINSRDGVVTLEIVMAANNPCYRTSPDIDAKGVITIDAARRQVTFRGLVEPFPAFEVYASTAKDGPRRLVTAPPLPGTTPWNLVGAPNREVAGVVTF